MIAFADAVLPVFITIFTGALVGGFVFELHMIQQAWKHHRENPVPALTRVTYPLRLAWYRVTRRMPGRCPLPDRYRLTDEDRAEFGAMTMLYHLRGIYADDPQRERRES